MKPPNLKLVASEWPEQTFSAAPLTPAERALLSQVYSHVRETTPAVLAEAQETAHILIELALDHECVAAALLVPLLRVRPDMTRALRERFGSRLIELAEGALRMGEIGALSGKAVSPQRPEAQAAQLEVLRKMLLAMVQDVRVVLIKLGDHLRELRAEVKSENTARRIELAELTRDIFAPLANRLGVWQLKWEL